MILQAGANDLALVVQILGSNEADHAVDEEGIESASDTVSSRFERQLVDSVVRFRGQGAALAGFEIHHVVSYPRNITLAMMFQNALAAFSQHGQIYTEADVGCLGSGDRLKQQIDRSATIQARQLGGDVREATRLRGNAQHRNQAVERAQDSSDNLDGIRGRIHSDDSVSATVEQAVKSSQQNAADVIGFRVSGVQCGTNAAVPQEIGDALKMSFLSRHYLVCRSDDAI